MPDINVNKLSEALNTKADIDLNNTGVFSTSEGGGVNLTSSTPADASGKEVTSADFFQSNLLNYTTNRILKIPQDIKLELNNGTLTLKAGSKVYVPNGKNSDGSNKFDVVTVENDTTYSYVYTSAVKCYALYDYSAKRLQIISLTDNGISYDSTTNKVIYTALSDTVLSFPFALVVRDTTGIGSIDQVFNGFGYIVSTVFVLPGVKVQIPNGRNTDGTYNYLLKETTSVTRRNVSGSKFNQYVMISTNEDIAGPTEQVKYDSELNSYIYTHDNSKKSWCIFAELNFESGKITSWKPYTVDSIANSNASNFSQAGRSYLPGLGMPSNRYIDLTLGASGSTYTAPANGWFFLNTWATSTATAYYQLHNRTSDLALLAVPDQGHVYQQKGFIPCKTGDIVALVYSNIDTTKTRWRFIYAQGEQ